MKHFGIYIQIGYKHYHMGVEETEQHIVIVD